MAANAGCEKQIMNHESELQSILKGNQCICAAPAFDAVSARIAQVLGWRVTKLSGSVAKASAGRSDNDEAWNLSDLVIACQRITSLCDLPLVIDADTGGHSKRAVRRTVRDLEHAGVAGIEIEDSMTSAPRGHRLLPIDDALARLSEATASRRSDSTAIIARTRSLALLQEPEALDRLARYSNSGVDAVMLVHPPSAEAISRAHAAAGLPLVVIGNTEGREYDIDFLTKVGVRLCYYVGHIPFRMSIAAIAAAYDCLFANDLTGLGRDRVASDAQVSFLLDIREQ
jgi:oxaloacetate decarboxylase